MPLAIVQDGAKPGAILMQEDFELLMRVENGDDHSFLRFYEWDKPTLSLGFHQSESTIDESALHAADVPWVRRPTGGAAVLHSEELTYAIVQPMTETADAHHVQEIISHALAEGLRAIGVNAHVDARGDVLTALPNRTSCFVRTSRWEVTAGGRKIVGSAQRKLTRAILQHGSILTGDDHLRIADFLVLPDEAARTELWSKLRNKSTSIGAELGHPVAMQDLRQAMEQSFRAAFESMSSLVSSRATA
jgi:lipoyl(octanoyl) transferase